SPERYQLAQVEPGGVLVDLESGNVFRLNQTAALICSIVLRVPNNVDDAVSQVQRALRLEPDHAARAVTDIITQLSGPAVRGTIQGSHHFRPSGGGDYGVGHRERRGRG